MVSPATLAEVHRLKKQFVGQAGREQVKLVFGNTASGVYQQEKPTYFIDISGIAELGRIAEQESGIRVGAAVPIQRLIDVSTEVIGRRPAEQTTGLRALNRHAGFIAGYQVRCAGSVAGNIFMTRDHAHRGAPFPSDLFTILATLGTTIHIGSHEYDGRAADVPLIEMPAVEDAARRRRHPVLPRPLHRGRASTCRRTGSPAGRRCRTRSSTPGFRVPSRRQRTRRSGRSRRSSTAAWLP